MVYVWFLRTRCGRVMYVVAEDSHKAMVEACRVGPVLPDKCPAFLPNRIVELRQVRDADARRGTDEGYCVSIDAVAPNTEEVLASFRDEE